MQLCSRGRHKLRVERNRRLRWIRAPGHHVRRLDEPTILDGRAAQRFGRRVRNRLRAHLVRSDVMRALMHVPVREPNIARRSQGQKSERDQRKSRPPSTLAHGGAHRNDAHPMHSCRLACASRLVGALTHVNPFTWSVGLAHPAGVLRRGRNAGQRARRPRSRSTSRAQLRPGKPVTPPPGCAPEPHRYRPLSGER